MVYFFVFWITKQISKKSFVLSTCCFVLCSLSISKKKVKTTHLSMKTTNVNKRNREKMGSLLSHSYFVRDVNCVLRCHNQTRTTQSDLTLTPQFFGQLVDTSYVVVGCQKSSSNLLNCWSYSCSRSLLGFDT